MIIHSLIKIAKNGLCIRLSFKEGKYNIVTTSISLGLHPSLGTLVIVRLQSNFSWML